MTGHSVRDTYVFGHKIQGLLSALITAQAMVAEGNELERLESDVCSRILTETYLQTLCCTDHAPSEIWLSC
jgi:hypothetical protein